MPRTRLETAQRALTGGFIVLLIANTILGYGGVVYLLWKIVRYLPHGRPASLDKVPHKLGNKAHSEILAVSIAGLERDPFPSLY